MKEKPGIEMNQEIHNILYLISSMLIALNITIVYLDYMLMNKITIKYYGIYLTIIAIIIVIIGIMYKPLHRNVQIKVSYKKLTIVIYFSIMLSFLVTSLSYITLQSNEITSEALAVMTFISSILTVSLILILIAQIEKLESWIHEEKQKTI